MLKVTNIVTKNPESLTFRQRSTLNDYKIGPRCMKFAREIRSNIKGKVLDFAREDPREYPNIWIQIIDRKRPSGHVYLMGGVGTSRLSEKLDTFNGPAQLGLLVEILCHEWRKFKKRSGP